MFVILEKILTVSVQSSGIHVIPYVDCDSLFDVGYVNIFYCCHRCEIRLSRFEYSADPQLKRRKSVKGIDVNDNP